jgi:hypothetical protein
MKRVGVIPSYCSIEFNTSREATVDYGMTILIGDWMFVQHGKGATRKWPLSWNLPCFCFTCEQRF